METNGDAVAVESFAVVAAASADAGDVVPFSSTTVRATFVAKSRRNCCSRWWKLWSMSNPTMFLEPLMTEVSLGDTRMMLFVSPVPFPS